MGKKTKKSQDNRTKIIKTERDNREKRITTMKKSQTWGKRRELFGNEHASGALRAPPYIIPDHTCVARIRTITKAGP